MEKENELKNVLINLDLAREQLDKEINTKPIILNDKEQTEFVKSLKNDMDELLEKPLEAYIISIAKVVSNSTVKYGVSSGAVAIEIFTATFLFNALKCQGMPDIVFNEMTNNIFSMLKDIKKLKG